MSKASIQALREKRATAAEKMRNLFDTNPTTGEIDVSTTQWTEEKQTEYQALKAEVEDCDMKIDALKSVMSLSDREEIDEVIENLADKENKSVDEVTARRNAHRGLLNTWIRSGTQAFSEEQRELYSAHLDWVRENSTEGPKNVQMTTPDGSGGYTFNEDLVPELLLKLKDFGGMREGARVVTKTNGRKTEWPTLDRTSLKGVIVSEGAQASDADLTFGQADIEFDKWSSKVFSVSYELIQDSSIDIISVIIDTLGEALARGQNEAFTKGTSNNADHVVGILEGIPIGHTAPNGSKQVTTINFPTLLNLVHSVDPAYRRQGFKLMFNDNTLLKLKQIEDKEGRPLWLPGVTSGEPNIIYGYPYMINQDMPNMASMMR